MSTPDNPLRLIPSVYVWPHVRVNCDAPWPLAVLDPPATMGSGLAGRPAPASSCGRCARPPTRPAYASPARRRAAALYRGRAPLSGSSDRACRIAAALTEAGSSPRSATATT